jgi:hypothetical protein
MDRDVAPQTLERVAVAGAPAAGAADAGADARQAGGYAF